jgi:RNA polymerase sigma-70 factor (ECF subfamily)
MTIHATPLPESSPDDTPVQLLRAARQGDNEAWARLIEWFRPGVLSQLRRANVDTHSTEDLFQDVLLAVLRRIGSFERRRSGSFRRYLRKTVFSRLTDFRRARQRTKEYSGQELLDHHPQPPAACPEADMDPAFRDFIQIALERIRMEFATKNWEAFWRGVVLGEDLPTLQRELGMTHGAYYHARARILHALRTEIGELPPDR